MEMKSQPNLLNVIFLPFPLPGHTNPMVDTARLFAKHGVNVTIIATQANALTFQNVIDSDSSSGYSIRTHVIQFPAAQLGVPDGVENVKAGLSPEMLIKIGQGTSILQHQLELLLPDLHPDCLVTDMLYNWTVDLAAKLGIPRLFFYSSSYFAGCATHLIKKHKPHERLVSDTNKFSIPELPHNIEMETTQLEEWVKMKNNDVADFLKTLYEAMDESESRSYGTLCNSFHELESHYEKLYKTTIGVKSWSVGPVSAWVKRYDGEKQDLPKEAEWLNWLNSKKNDSVLYVSFGSVTRLPHAQLVEIAHGLENCGQNFIWVVRNMDGDDEDGDSLPQGFEERMKQSKKGYIIWNWAPQLLILNHPATGGILTHCGWNSILESVSAGLPMITWPMFADQFYNEKLLSDVLKVGVPVGSKVNKFWIKTDEDTLVSREEIVKAVKLLMGSGEESKEMRERARKLGDAAKRATEKDGSSYNNLVQLIEELKSLKISRALEKIN